MTSGKPLRVSDFDYDLPPELIAQHPLARRDDSRMMIVDRKAGDDPARPVPGLPGLMAAGDLLVLNDTRVLPARLWGTSGEAKIEFLFVREIGPGRLGGPLPAGEKGPRRRRRPSSPPASTARVAGDRRRGPARPRFRQDRRPRPSPRSRLRPPAALHQTRQAGREREARGHRPVPDGLRQEGRRDRRADRGPSLHRTSPARAQGQGRRCPPRHPRRRPGHLPARSGRISSKTTRCSRRRTRSRRPRPGPSTRRSPKAGPSRPSARRSSGRSKAPGKTARSAPAGGATSLFIRPGYEFHVVDRLLTNFHLPQSTLLMLVSAFAGYDLVMRAYREAVRERYRFFSYGDCMLLI